MNTKIKILKLLFKIKGYIQEKDDEEKKGRRPGNRKWLKKLSRDLEVIKKYIEGKRCQYLIKKTKYCKLRKDICWEVNEDECKLRKKQEEKEKAQEVDKNLVKCIGTMFRIKKSQSPLPKS